MRWVPMGVCLLCDRRAGIVPNLCDACRWDLPILEEPCTVCGARAAYRDLPGMFVSAASC